MRRPEQHYCKHCGSYFTVKVHEKESGDFILECPMCKNCHYRRFENGIAVHCDVALRTGDLVKLKTGEMF